MILRRVPTSMLVALGLLPIDACKCPLGPCLEPAVEDPDVGPCLSEPARDDATKPEPPADDPLRPCLSVPPDDGVTPCLSPPEPPAHPCLSPIPSDEPRPAEPEPRPEPPVGPCLSVAAPVRENGKGGGQGKPPSDEPFARADVVKRVLGRGDLPEDVLARLRGRA